MFPVLAALDTADGGMTYSEPFSDVGLADMPMQGADYRNISLCQFGTRIGFSLVVARSKGRAPHINGASDGLNVSRVHTGAIPAQMITFQSLGNRRDKRLIG